MSDIGRYLPLSQRPQHDESGVSGNWAPQIAAVLRSTADLLDSSTTGNAPSWDSPAARAGYSVRDTVGHILVHRTFSDRAGRRERLLASLAPVLTSGATLERRQREKSRAVASASPQELVRALRDAAAVASSPASHATLRELSFVVVDAFDIARSLGHELAMDGATSGAVAIARALVAPLPVRAVLRRRRLSAVGADWEVGTGTQITAPAADIVLFLWQRAGLPGGETVSGS